MKLATLKIRIDLALAVVVVLAIFLMPAFANGATWYVSPDGDDTNDGSELNPWRTIQHAVDQASPGDTIKVMDDDNEATDDYTENITVDKRLTIERYNDTGANPQIKASSASSHVFYVTANNVTIRGLDIYGATDPGNAGIFLKRDCTIQNNRCGWDSDHMNFLGIYLASSSNNTISGNTCSNEGYGIYLISSYSNTISGNTCSNSFDGIYLAFSSNNTISGNTCSNLDYGIRLHAYSNNNTVSGNISRSNYRYGIELHDSSSNTIYLNTFRSNNIGNVSDYDSTNTWRSPSKLGYLYGSSTQTYKNYMGNYYDDYSGSDSDNDGIGDSPYGLPGDEPDDEYPLMEPSGNYDLQTWWLANPIMYRGDMSQPGATIIISGSSYQIWAADEAALTDISFGTGDEAEGTTWTGQVTFSSAPAIGYTFMLEIGYADDQSGTNFTSGGPNATIIGDGSTEAFTFTTDAVSFTVPQGKYLAMKMTNNSGSDYNVRVGGSWSYVSAPLNISGYVRGDVSGNGTVSAYDAAMVLQYVVGLITLTDTQIEAADVSKNGTVSAYDAALILQYVIGLIPSFPEESRVDAPILNVTSESEMLAKVIKQLEGMRLDDEQKRVLEQLKRLLTQKPIPVYTALLQNYPNPFNPETWIPYQLATDSPVMISIYNVKGQMIRTISLGTKQAGIYITKDRAVYWDGNDSFGQPVASGVYYYTLQVREAIPQSGAGEFRATRKMVIMK